MTEFIVGDRVWVVDRQHDTRYPGVVELVRDKTHELTVQIDDGGPKLRVFKGTCTLRESHE